MKNHFFSSRVSVPSLLTVFWELKAYIVHIAWLDFKKSLFVLFVLLSVVQYLHGKLMNMQSVTIYSPDL